LSTAARAGELLNLLWRDVDTKEGRVIFRLTKNSEPRVAWLLGEALKLMKKRAGKKPDAEGKVFASPGGFAYDYSTPFKEAIKAAEIVDFRFHDLRHTAATALAREGASEQQLKAIGGWKSGIVSRYVHIASTDAKTILQKMNKSVMGSRKLKKRAKTVSNQRPQTSGPND
jgi:integrase